VGRFSSCALANDGSFMANPFIATTNDCKVDAKSPRVRVPSLNQIRRMAAVIGYIYLHPEKHGLLMSLTSPMEV
jgi:hypothetical protein